MSEDNTNVLTAAQRNVKQLLDDAGDAQTALEQGQKHRQNALEQLERSKQIAESATVTVAILESIVEHESESADDEAAAEEDLAEVVEGVES